MKYNLLQLSQLLLTAAAQLSLPWTFISGYLFGSSFMDIYFWISFWQFIRFMRSNLCGEDFGTSS
jgi:hypothetical protein